MAVFTAAYAMSLAKVTYANTAQRLSILSNNLLAVFVLKEKRDGERFAGGLLMVAKFVLITLFD